MSEEGRAAVADKGFFEIDRDGDMVTPLVPGSEECAYTLFDEDGNCFCSMERCWFQGKGDRSESPSSVTEQGLSTSTGGIYVRMHSPRAKKKRSAYMSFYANR